MRGGSSKLRSPLHQGGFQLINAPFQGTSPVVAAVQQLLLGGCSLVSHQLMNVVLCQGIVLAPAGSQRQQRHLSKQSLAERPRISFQSVRHGISHNSHFKAGACYQLVAGQLLDIDLIMTQQHAYTLLNILDYIKFLQQQGAW